MKNRSHQFTNISSDLHDLYVFLESSEFVVVTYKNHWEQKSRYLFTDPKEALEEAKKDKRSLLYCITKVGRTATFGSTSFCKLELLLLEEAAREKAHGETNAGINDKKSKPPSVKTYTKRRRANKILL